MPPHNPPAAIGLPIAVIPGWGVDYPGSSGWWWEAGSRGQANTLAVRLPWCGVRRAVSVRLLWWSWTFRYGRPLIARVVVRNADEFAAAVAGLSGRASESADREFMARLSREWAARN